MQLGPPIYTEHEKEQAIRNCQKSQYQPKKGVPEGSKKEEGGVHPDTNASGKDVPEEKGDTNTIEANKGKKRKKMNYEKNKGGGGDTLISVNKALGIFEILTVVMSGYQAKLNETTDKDVKSSYGRR